MKYIWNEITNAKKLSKKIIRLDKTKKQNKNKI